MTSHIPATTTSTNAVGTKYTISQNDKFLEFFAQYLLLLSSKMLPIKVCIDGEHFTSIA